MGTLHPVVGNDTVKDASGVAPSKVMKVWDKEGWERLPSSIMGAARERAMKRKRAELKRNFIMSFAFRSMWMSNVPGKVSF